jgi:hypothetical protein
VIFSNLGQREIVNTQNDNDIVFYALEVANSSKVVTSSNFQVQNEINVVGNGSLKQTTEQSHLLAMEIYI